MVLPTPTQVQIAYGTENCAKHTDRFIIWRWNRMVQPIVAGRQLVIENQAGRA